MEMYKSVVQMVIIIFCGHSIGIAQCTEEHPNRRQQ